MNNLTRALNVSKFGISRNDDFPSLGKITNARRYDIFDPVVDNSTERIPAICPMDFRT